MAYRKLNRASGNRKALFRSLSSALIMNGRIETTITKAKETSKNVAKLTQVPGQTGRLHPYLPGWSSSWRCSRNGDY